MERIVRVLGVVSFTLLIATSGWSADGKKKSVTVSEVKKGDGVVVEVSEALARSILEGAIGTELDCRGDLDSEFEGLLRTLDEGGRGSRATLRNDDTVIRAVRRRKSIKLEIGDRDGDGKIEAIVPWALAECLLGRATKIGDTAAPVKVKITGDDGGTFEFRVN